MTLELCARPWRYSSVGVRQARCLESLECLEHLEYEECSKYSKYEERRQEVVKAGVARGVARAS